MPRDYLVNEYLLRIYGDMAQTKTATLDGMGVPSNSPLRELQVKRADLDLAHEAGFKTICGLKLVERKTVKPNDPPKWKSGGKC